MEADQAPNLANATNQMQIAADEVERKLHRVDILSSIQVPQILRSLEEIQQTVARLDNA